MLVVIARWNQHERPTQTWRENADWWLRIRILVFELRVYVTSKITWNCTCVSSTLHQMYVRQPQYNQLHDVFCPYGSTACIHVHGPRSTGKTGTTRSALRVVGAIVHARGTSNTGYCTMQSFSFKSASERAVVCRLCHVRQAKRNSWKALGKAKGSLSLPSLQALPGTTTPNASRMDVKANSLLS